MADRQLLSVVIPCYNEEAVVAALHDRLSQVAAGLSGLDVEMLFIDNGSRDNTAAELIKLRRNDPRVRIMRFSRNFGHQMAVTAGLEHARGDAVVVINADLQHSPEVIGEMVQRWHEGLQIVHGVRTRRTGETAFKRGSAGLFYRLINWMSDTEIPVDTGDFRLMDRKVVDALRSMPERDRVVRGLVGWVGFRQGSVEYVGAPRHAGETKYTMGKMFRFALDGVASFSIAPLRLASLVGFVASIFALVGILYVLGVRLFTRSWVSGWAGIVISVLFMGGVQLISLGIIGEYVGRIYGEVKRRPLYILQERIGFDED